MCVWNVAHAELKAKTWGYLSKLHIWLCSWLAQRPQWFPLVTKVHTPELAIQNGQQHGPNLPLQWLPGPAVLKFTHRAFSQAGCCWRVDFSLFHSSKLLEFTNPAWMSIFFFYWCLLSFTQIELFFLCASRPQHWVWISVSMLSYGAPVVSTKQDCDSVTFLFFLANLCRVQHRA